MNAKQDYT